MTRLAIAKGGWPFEVRPDLGLENPHDLVERRQVLEQRLHEAKAAIAGIVDEFDRGDIDYVGADLTVTNHPVPGELETGQFKGRACAL